MDRIASFILYLLSLLQLTTLPPKIVSSPPPTSSPVTIIARNLDIPWAMDFLPDGSLLVTERPGRVRHGSDILATIPEVKHYGEGGLMGIAVDPDFTINNYIYLYYTYNINGDKTANRLVRYDFKENELQNPRTLIDNIPGAIFHNGGRIKFGPDKYLYITTGDATDPSLSQDPQSYAGKILRLDPSTSSVEIYSLGHRNPQGLAWDDTGQLWSTEHGDAAHDELNKIIQGQNYGWPIIRGPKTKTGLVSPIIDSGSDTWAPGGIAFTNGQFYFGGLRGQVLFSYPPLTPHFKNEFGRIRDVVFGPDGYLYITTSNRDGRGTPKPEDDKLIKLKLPI